MVTRFTNKLDGIQSTLGSSGEMMQRVIDFPDQLMKTKEAMERQRSRLELIDRDPKKISRVLLLGMGGSGIIGDFVRILLRKSSVSVHVCKNSVAPNYAMDGRSLVIAVTYSGKTAETLGTLRSMISSGNNNIAVVTSSRDLSKQCADEDIACIQIPANGYSRASFGNMLLPVLEILQHVGLLKNIEHDINETMSIIEGILKDNRPSEPIERNAARWVALNLANKIPVIYGIADSTDAVALRWKQQLNENAKTFCHCDTLPELLHNEIEIWNSHSVGSSPVENQSSFCLILFRDPEFELESQIADKLEVTKSLARNSGSRVIDIPSNGRSELARLLSLSYFGDFVSVYLASLKHMDPSKIPNIEQVKSSKLTSKAESNEVALKIKDSRS